jgi:hypothetical protein
MPGLVPGIHVFLFYLFSKQTWMAGTSPAMTENRCPRGRRYPAASLASAGRLPSSACSVTRVE